MKTFKTLFLVVVVILAATAHETMAITVTINANNGQCTGTLSHANLDSSGNITIDASSLTGNCLSSSPPPGCPPSQAVITPTTISISVTQGSNALSKTVSIKDDCGNNLNYTATATVTQGTWLIVPNSGTGSLTITFNTASLAAGTYSGTISITPTGYTSQTITVSLTVSTGGGIKYIDITTSGRTPNVLKNQTVAAYKNGDPGEAYYSFTTTESFNKISINLEAAIDASGDYSEDLDLMVSNVSHPHCPAYDKRQSSFSKGSNGLWYTPMIGRSNETILVTMKDANGRLQPIPPATWYITICNYGITKGLDGKFYISWDGYY